MNHCCAGISLEVLYNAFGAQFPPTRPKFICQQDFCIIMWLAVCQLSRGMLPTYTVAFTRLAALESVSLRLVPRSCESRSISPDSLRSEFPRPAAAFIFAFWIVIGNFPYLCIGGRCRRATSSNNALAKELTIGTNYRSFIFNQGMSRPAHVLLIRVIWRQRCCKQVTFNWEARLSNGLSSIVYNRLLALSWRSV